MFPVVEQPQNTSLVAQKLAEIQKIDHYHPNRRLSRPDAPKRAARAYLSVLEQFQALGLPARGNLAHCMLVAELF